MRKLLFCFMFLLPLFSIAKAETITMGIAVNLPPYNMLEQQRGLEFSIVQAALAEEGLNMHAQASSLTTLPSQIKKQVVDGGFPVITQQEEGLYLSQPHLTYRTVAATLKHKNLTLDSIENLAGLHIVSFPGARNTLGEVYAQAVAQAASYQEIESPQTRVHMLYAEHVDAVVIDRNIFSWYQHQFANSGLIPPFKDATFHPIFPPIFSHVAFSNPTLRNRFDQGLAKLKQSGKYDDIVIEYLTE